MTIEAFFNEKSMNPEIIDDFLVRARKEINKNELAKLLADRMHLSYLDGWLTPCSYDRLRNTDYVFKAMPKIYAMTLDLFDLLNNKAEIIKMLLVKSGYARLCQHVKEGMDFDNDPMSDVIISNLMRGKVNEQSLVDMINGIKPKSMEISLEFNIRSSYGYKQLLFYHQTPGTHVPECIVNKFKEVMFTISGNDLYALHVEDNHREIVKIDNMPMCVMYRYKEYPLMDLIKRYVCSYTGIVNEVGPDIIIKGYDKYININSLGSIILNDFDAFIHSIDSILDPDVVYSPDELYNVFTNHTRNAMSKRTFHNTIQSHVIDVTNKSKINHEEQLCRFKPGALIKTTYTKDNTIKYYLFKNKVPDNTKHPIL